jgi:urease accessory protein
MSVSETRAAVRAFGHCVPRHRVASCLLATIAALYSLATPALAHHPMGGKTPSTFMEGLLSGIGHPVIGPDHLAFIIAIGIAASLLTRGSALIAAFIAASTAGVLVHLTGADVPAVEVIVASSVVLAGLALAVVDRPSRPAWLVLAALAGLFHGYAFGEATIGAERGVLGAYLIGLAIVSAVTASVAMLLARRLLSDPRLSAARTRVAGGVLGVFGMALLGLRFIA